MEQIEKNRRLLRLKGVEPAEDTTVPLIPETVLRQFKERKTVKQNAAEFDDLQLNWNPDGTLNLMTAYRNGEVLYEMQFMWNADGTLNSVRRSD